MKELLDKKLGLSPVEKNVIFIYEDDKTDRSHKYWEVRPYSFFNFIK